MEVFLAEKFVFVRKIFPVTKFNALSTLLTASNHGNPFGHVRFRNGLGPGYFFH